MNPNTSVNHNLREWIKSPNKKQKIFNWINKTKFSNMLHKEKMYLKYSDKKTERKGMEKYIKKILTEGKLVDNIIPDKTDIKAKMTH